MHKFNNNQSPVIFNDFIKKPNHRYPTNFSVNNFIRRKYSLSSTNSQFLYEDLDLG